VNATSAASQRSGAASSGGGELHKGSPVFLALTAIGVVFGDIGTSPLYTLSVTLGATGHALPTASDVLGIVSLIFWALMAIVSLKYVVLVLRADNDGEGGILALLSLVASERIANGPGMPILVLLGIVGAALLYGDGVITPAISVLSAMEGLRLVAPAFEDFILPLTLAILIGLFMMQRRGTASIGRLFGPIMVSWFVVIGLLGVINIWAAPEILKALSPGEAARFVLANPLIAFAVMGGVFLALTGAEALTPTWAMSVLPPSAARGSVWCCRRCCSTISARARSFSPIPRQPIVRFTNWPRIGRLFRWSAWRRWRPSSLPRRSSPASSPSLGRRCSWGFARACGSCPRRPRRPVRYTCPRPIGC